MDKLMEKRHPVMLVGPPGSGKTVLINDKLSQLSEDYMVTRVPFNFYTTSGETPPKAAEGAGRGGGRTGLQFALLICFRDERLGFWYRCVHRHRR